MELIYNLRWFNKFKFVKCGDHSWRFEYLIENLIIRFTQYNIAVHPSMVIHWNTVNIANPILSKLVIPEFGPSHSSRHTLIFLSQKYAPGGPTVLFPSLQGVAASPSLAICAGILNKHCNGMICYLLKNTH